MSDDQLWESCPRCNSNRVKVNGKAFYFILGLCLAGCLFWLGFMFPPLWIGALGGGVLMITAPFMPPVLQCKDCNKSWRTTKNKKPAR